VVSVLDVNVMWLYSLMLLLLVVGVIPRLSGHLLALMQLD